jgi:predicted amidophosphoribosyltransferase
MKSEVTCTKCQKKVPYLKSEYLANGKCVCMNCYREMTQAVIVHKEAENDDNENLLKMP